MVAGGSMDDCGVTPPCSEVPLSSGFSLAFAIDKLYQL